MSINIQTDGDQDKNTPTKEPKKETKSVSKRKDIQKESDLVPRSQIDEIVAQEVAKLKEKLEAEAIKKIKKDEDNIIIDLYLDKTRLTDKKFIAQLIKWQITPTIAADLENKDSELTREKLWEYIRKEHRPKK